MPPSEIVIDLNPTILHLGPIVLTATGLSIGMALVIAMFVGEAGLRARNIAPSALYDAALRAIPAGLIGGRIFQVADNWTYYSVHPFAIVAPGGFALDGAVLAGGVVALRVLHKLGVSYGEFFDALAPGLFLAMIVGGAGTLVSGGLLGKPAEVFMAVKYANPHSFDQRGLFVFPVAAYLILWFAIGGILYRRVRARHVPTGTLARFSLLWLGVGQLWLGFFRSEPADLLGLSLGQILGSLLALIAIAMFIREAVRHRACTHSEYAAQATR